MTRLFFASVSALTLLSTSPSFAADLNTYRPGQAYLKSVAGHPDMCAQQCQGDAQCRGWNFVKTSPRAATGICEFNARAAMPVPSPVSISGEVRTSVDPLLSRAVPAGTRTVTVGTPAPMPMARPGSEMAAQPNPQSQMRRTIVNRQAIPAQGQSPTRPAAYAPHPPQKSQPVSPRTPRTYGDTQQAPQSAPSASSPAQHAAWQAPAAQPQLSPEQQYYRQQFLNQQSQNTRQDLIRRAQQHNTANMTARPQMPAAPMPAQAPKPSQTQNPYGQAPTTPAAPAPQPYAQPPYAPQATAPQPYPQQQSAQNRPRVSAHPALTPSLNYPMQTPKPLYGRLHDDITRRPPSFNRPGTAPTEIPDADTPIATSRAVPVKPVETAPLSPGAMPALAGG